MTRRDLTALPCSHPHCCSMEDLVHADAGEWKSLVGMIGHAWLREHLGPRCVLKRRAWVLAYLAVALAAGASGVAARWFGA